MISLRTHGTCSLESRRIRIDSDYSPGDGTMGTLRLTLENYENWEIVEAVFRLDPYGTEYYLIEFASANCLVLCGCPAVMVIGMDDLSLVPRPACLHARARERRILRDPILPARGGGG